MKKIILKTIFTACLMFQATCYLAAQVPTIEYIYDQGGNRVSRRVIPLQQNIKKHTVPTDSIEVVKDFLGEMEVKLYPNPTKGLLLVEVTGGKSDNEMDLILYNGGGHTLVNKQAKTGLNNLDLSNYPAGWYILQVKAGTEKKEYKIIKE